MSRRDVTRWIDQQQQIGDKTKMAYGTKVANAHDIDNTMTATPERMKHNGGVILAARSVTEGGISKSVGHQAINECVLDVMLGQKIEMGMLMGTQGTRLDRVAVARSRYEAGMRLRRLFMSAGLQQSVTADFGAASVGGGDPNGEGSDAARTRYNHILRRMGIWGELAASACCYDCLPHTAAQQDRIRQALDKLCLIEG